MALTTIPSELSSVSGIADSSDATAITIDSSENVTFAGNILKTGDLTVDVSGDIILDADGGNIVLKDGGTQFGDIYTSSNHLYIKSTVSDANIYFEGNDGGSAIGALTLDMSDAGTATFNHDIIMNTGGTIRNTSGQELQIGAMVGDGSNTIIKSAGDTIFQYYNGSAWVENVRFDDAKVGIGTGTPASALHILENHTTDVTTTGELVSGTSFTINGNNSEGSDVLRVGAMANATGDYFIDVSNSSGASTYNLLVNPFGGGLGVGTTSLTNSHMLKLKSVAGQSPLVELINSDSEDSDTGREASIRFSGFRSGGESTINAQISGHHLGSGDDDKGGLIFWHNTGSGSLSEAMRINEWGRLGIGTAGTAGTPTSALHVKATSNTYNDHILHVQRPDGLGHAAEPFSEILIQNQETTVGYEYGGMTIMAENQAHVRFQVGNSSTWAGTSAKRWQVRVGLGNAEDKLSVYSWTAGLEVMEMNTSGTTTFTAAASNYVIHAGSSTGKIGMGALNSSYYHWVRQSGPTSWYFSQATYADGGFHTYSDERLKKDITVISNAVDAVKKMRGVTFNWKVTEDRGREGKQFGCIAQDLLKVDENLPELMVDPLAKAGEEESTDKLYTLDYSRITPYLIEAIKEQQTLIETLQTKVAALEAK